MNQFKENDKVEWSWGNGSASGTVRKVYTSDVGKEIKGSEVRREANEDCPAYTIEQDDGDIVLKSHSEVRAAS
ncbi:MAG: DUF2945 domain-containing protein [Woeseia sp.]